MKQKFTIENFGEFINLKSNFKNVSLMKKQLFSLMYGVRPRSGLER
jgi:hypothetical protein